MIKKLYPQGKEKAFTVTYDDGVLQDVRFVALLNRYGLKGTFNLNSQLMADEFEWTHESGAVIKRLSIEQAATLYIGHEVASHSLTHPYMEHLREDELMHELLTDKASLEQIFCREIKGFAVPFDFYSERIGDCARNCGFSYVRLPEESRSFTPPEDTFRWKAGIFHLDADLNNYVNLFLKADEELAFCQIVGHSYDLDAENRWEPMEEIFRRVREDETVLPMTTIELIEYLRAMGQAEVTNRSIINTSDRSLWFRINGDVCEVVAHTEFQLNK